jgi:hypothetical protein
MPRALRMRREIQKVDRHLILGDKAATIGTSPLAYEQPGRWQSAREDFRWPDIDGLQMSRQGCGILLIK